MWRGPWHWVIRLIVVPVTLASVAVAGSSCSTGHVVTSSTEKSHVVEPSAGCGRSLARASVAAGRHQARTLDAEGVTGSYDLSVPRTYRAHRPVPLILLFYGFDSDPTQFSALTGLPARGSADGDLVVVPHTQGAESEWQFNAHGTDAAFVDALVASLELTYCVDRHSVFAAGFSAGAAFTIIYACARQDRITAIATVAVEFQLGCTRSMSIMAFHGTEDPLVPYRNGAIGLSLPGVRVRGTERNMGDWAQLDHCRAIPHQTRIGSQVVEQQWRGCARAASVVLYTIVGGGHSWPGADPDRAPGLTTQQVSATSQILSFFDSFGS
jgi:polyhydroxybutyrate depolymerase